MQWCDECKCEGVHFPLVIGQAAEFGQIYATRDPMHGHHYTEYQAVSVFIDDQLMADQDTMLSVASALAVTANKASPVRYVTVVLPSCVSGVKGASLGMATTIAIAEQSRQPMMIDVRWRKRKVAFTGFVNYEKVKPGGTVAVEPIDKLWIKLKGAARKNVILMFPTSSIAGGQQSAEMKQMLNEGMFMTFADVMHGSVDPQEFKGIAVETLGDAIAILNVIAER